MFITVCVMRFRNILSTADGTGTKLHTGPFWKPAINIVTFNQKNFNFAKIIKISFLVLLDDGQRWTY